jgi:heptosyltransferase-1
LTGPVGSGPIVILGGKGAQPAFGEAIRAVESNGLLSARV